MKKILIFIILLCLIITSCAKEETLTGSWENNFNSEKINLDEDTLTIFNTAKKDYSDQELEAVALLGTQVVAGKNYMFLAKGYQKDMEEKKSYKIVVVYHDLSGNSEITRVSDFNYANYTHKNIEGENEALSGGWQITSPIESISLPNDLQTAFDNATSTLTGMTYKPIMVLGTQVVAGTNYAILCYGRASYENMPESVYLITMYEDLKGNSEIISQSYVDLKEYN